MRSWLLGTASPAIWPAVHVKPQYVDALKVTLLDIYSPKAVAEVFVARTRSTTRRRLDASGIGNA